MYCKLVTLALLLFISTASFAQNEVESDCYKTIAKQAIFQDVSEVLIVQPATTSYVCLPPVTTQKPVVVVRKPAYKKVEWRNGVQCLVQYEATLDTVMTTVIVEPARVQEVVSPALFQQIQRKILVRDAYIKQVLIDCN